MDLHAQSTSRGVWITVQDGSVTVITAHRAEDHSGSPVTIYWNGQTSFTEMGDFFFYNKQDSHSATATVFTSAEMLKFEKIQSLAEVSAKVDSNDIGFLRLEASIRKRGQRSASENFALWSNLMLGRENAPMLNNMIGVCFSPQRLSSIEEQVSKYICHSNQVHNNYIIDGGIRELSRYLVSSGLSAPTVSA